MKVCVPRENFLAILRMRDTVEEGVNESSKDIDADDEAGGLVVEDEDETKKICLDTIKSVGASSVKDMGKVMGELKKKYSDVLDFSKVSRIIKENLN